MAPSRSGVLKIERTGTMSNFLSRRFIYLLTALLLGTALVTSQVLLLPEKPEAVLLRLLIIRTSII